MKISLRPKAVALTLGLALAALAWLSPSAVAVSPNIVISQVYGGAGCGTPGCSTYKNDFIELFNRGGSSVSVNGWSVQYASSSGTSWQVTNLPNVSIPAGGYLLISEGAGANGVNVIPTADGTGSIAMSATGAKVALVNVTTALSGACPSGAQLVDLVGYGSSANCKEGSTTAPAPSTTNAIFRGSHGCSDTDDNGTDFTAAAVSPRNSATTAAPCGGGLPTLSVNDVSVSEGNSGTTAFTFTVSLSAAAPAGGVTFDIATANSTASAPADFTARSLTGVTIAEGLQTYSFTVDVNGDLTPEISENFFVNVTNVTNATLADGQGQGAIANDDIAPDLTVNDVSQTEGDSGTTTLTFTVSLSMPAPAGGVTFDIATANGTASEPGDFTARSLTSENIPEGSSSYSFTVDVNGDAVPEANETFFVNVSNATNAIVTDSQGLGTIRNDDYTPIHDIQGSGATSPLSGVVTTRGIVTALKLSGANPNGFFLQTPDAAADSDPSTSEGIFVFTSSTPPGSVVVGNEVAVSGTISEFAPSADALQPPLTEIVSPTITLLSSGNPLPAPVVLTSSFPDPNGAFDQLEAIEGMRVSVPSMTVVAPTGGNVSEANSTASPDGVFFGVVTGVARPFREAGIQAPDPAPSGSIPPIPRFDTNPERIRVDSDRQPGTTAMDVSTGTLITGLVGVLDYTNRAYTLNPDPTPEPMVSGGAVGTSVSTPAANQVTVAAMNIRRFFDMTNDPSTSDVVLTSTAFQGRLAKTSKAIRESLKFPDIIGLQEVENLAVLQALAAAVSSDAVAASQPDPHYEAYLVEGNDIGGIDVGFLVKTAEVAPCTPRVSVIDVVQEDKNELFVNPDSSTENLHDRPNLRLRATVNYASGESFDITVVNVHLRSLGSVAATTPGSSGWATDGDRVRAKRQKQAESVANLVQARQLANPAERIMVIGDFNAFEINDGYGHSVAVIKGTPVPDNETAVSGDGIDLVNPDLVDMADSLPADEHYSYSFDGNAQTLDQVLANAPLLADAIGGAHLEHARINADFQESHTGDFSSALRISDHDPSVAYFAFLPGAPVVSDASATNVTASGADLQAEVTFDGGAAVSSRGFVYAETATNSEPEIGGAGVTTVPVAGTTGAMSTTITGLAGSVGYSFKAFAANSAGTTYSSATTFTTDPAPCAPGTWSASGMTPCTPASPGHFVPDAGATSETACAAGSYQPDSGAESCLDAEAGYFAATSGLAAPEACELGYYQPLPGQTSCLPADPGSYVDAPGSAAQTMCAAGSYQPVPAQSSCTLASVGYYVPAPGAIAQIACAPGYTSSEGATACSQAPPSLSIGDAAIIEGDGGLKAVKLTVTRANSNAAVTFNWATVASGDAVAGVDFSSASGTASIPEGPIGASTSFYVTVVGDTLNEGDETFSVRISDASWGSISDDTAVVTIGDNDPIPTLRLSSNLAVLEGSLPGGTRTMTFTVALSTASSRTVTVGYSIGGGTATRGSGAFVAGDDYAVPGGDTGLLTFTPGETSKSIPVTTYHDLLSEGAETFAVTLVDSPATPLSNATIQAGAGLATGTIRNDDGAPSLRITDVTVVEGASTGGSLKAYLSAPTSVDVTVNWTTTNGTATSPSDFAAASGTLTIPAGATEAQIPSIAILAGDGAEGIQRFTVNLSVASGASIEKAIGIVTIPANLN